MAVRVLRPSNKPSPTANLQPTEGKLIASFPASSPASAPSGESPIEQNVPLCQGILPTWRNALSAPSPATATAPNP